MADGNFMDCACAICASGTDNNFQLDQTGTGNNIRFVPDTGDIYLDSMIYGTAWDDPTILYSFPTSADDYGSNYDGEANGFIELTLAMKQAADFALSDYWGGDAQAGFSVAGFTGLNVDWTDDPDDNAHIRLAQTDEPGIANTAWAYYPSTGMKGGDAWFYTGVYDYTNPQAGNYAWATMIHEIGHSLGLRHPHDRTPVMPGDMDHMEYTVMSYRSYEGAPTGYRNEPGGYAQTWMMLDIAALQELYGADFTPNDGDVVYSWTPGSGNTYVNGDVAIDAVDNRIFATIWDGGGNVTYDLSAYDSGVQIDLRPGKHSVFDDAQLAGLGNGNFASGNIYNALLYNDDPRSLISNAIGGDGDDTIRGNDADNSITGGGGNNVIHGVAGDNTLRGGDGDNKIWGGSGNDSIHGNPGNDTIGGGGGNNTIWGGTGDNVIYGGTGGSDLIGGGTGDSRIWVSDGDNTIYGGTGNNTIGGSFTGDDEIWGGTGDAVIYARGGNNTIGGGTGDNRIWGGPGDDLIFGSAGNDTIGAGWGDDTIWGGAGDNVIYGQGGNNVLNGTSQGNDTIWGARGDDTIDGRGGDNWLYGGAGDDVIMGGSGNDTITGAWGDDTITGGGGADTFVFARGHGNNVITDFDTDDGDILELDDNLWSGTLTATQIVSQYATTVSDGILFDFDDGTRILLRDFTDLSALDDHINIV